MSTVFVSGVAGFIGYHLAKSLIAKGYVVVAVDEINEYYDRDLKIARLNDLGVLLSPTGLRFENSDKTLLFYRGSTSNREFIEDVFSKYNFDYVVHLAAQAGVRHSINKPYEFINSNVNGFLPILEACKKNKPKHFVFASSSSVYGNSDHDVFRESDNVDYPVSLYAATKKSNELMAYTYSYLYKIPTTGLRFFSVYGPWGRPDMAYYKFTRSIFNSECINIYNKGNLKRDFTYIDDAVTSIVKVMEKSVNESDYQLFNVGNSNSIRLLDFIEMLENVIGIKANKKFVDMQPGDVFQTIASNDKLFKYIDFKPQTLLFDGLSKFVSWYRSYYKIDL